MNNYIYDTEFPKDYMRTEKSCFRLASVFNGCPVFKRNVPFEIFGECPEKSVINAVLKKKQKIICTDTVRSKAPAKKVYGHNDTFNLKLPAQKGGDGYELIVTCMHKGDFKTQHVKNICFGEVFLAGGQSNMEFELKNCAEGPEALKHDDPDVRYYYTPKNHIFDAKFTKDENASRWVKFSRTKAKNWSAVGYFFAKELSERLHCPVGIIGCNWGGTSASAWMPYETLETDSRLCDYIADYIADIGDSDADEQKTEWERYITYNTAWQKRIDKIYRKDPKTSWEDALKKAGECKYPGPLNSFNPMRPSGLYETMLKRVAPYTISGFIYYQGESDDHKPEIYDRLFSKLIYYWRRLWNDETLPFLFVQLPMHKYIGDEDKKNWCMIRDAQTYVLEHVPNTGMAVALDCGAYNDIHPKKKKAVAHRLVLQALEKIYGLATEDEADSPIFDSCVSANGKIILKFKHAKIGFEVKESIPDGDPTPNEKINAARFEISADGEHWKDADFHINGSEIEVSSESVLNPEYLRYAYTNYGKVTIFAKNTLPLTPFECRI